MTTKICKNLPCSKPFETERVNKVFCCNNCAANSARRKQYSTSPGARLKRLAASKAWRQSQPETYKSVIRKSIGKKYVSGKNLPPWMFS